jgi:signal transduction histidine kinase
MPGDQEARPVIAPAATRRIARLKLLTAVLLVLGLTIVLSLYAFLVARADARFELDRIDGLLERRVAEGVGAVRVATDGSLVMRSDAGAALDVGYPQLYIIDVDDAGGRGRVVSRPDEPRWLGHEIVDVADDASRGDATTSTVATTHDVEEGEQLRILTAPVHDRNGEARGAVVGVATRTPGQESSGRLVSYMWKLALPLIAVSVAVAVFLSRGRWWVADVVLKAHEQFVAYTAHELRGRVGAMSAVVETGLAGVEPAERTLERVAAIVNGTQETIDDLMTLSNVETGRQPLRAEPVRLDALVETLVAGRTDEPPIRLATHVSVVTVNVQLVRRAVDNLLDNAVRHGRARDPGAIITVTVRGGCVEVADRGPGVKPQLLTHLVERARGNGHRATGGGLGLTIAAWVARVHGGGLRATNRVGGGAVFTLMLPGAVELSAASMISALQASTGRPALVGQP